MTMQHDAASRVRTLVEDDERLRRILVTHKRRSDDARFVLPPLQRGSARPLNESRFVDSASAAKAWSESRAVEGWLQCQSRQLAFRSGAPEIDAEWGALLAAEGVDAQGRSIRLARNGQSLWVLIWTEHDAQGDDAWDEVRHLASAQEFGALVYRRYWRADPEVGMRIHAAHFFGFEPV